MNDHPSSPFLPDDLDRLARYWAGESDIVEAREVEQWLAHQTDNAELLAALRSAWSAFDVAPASTEDTERLRQRVRAHISRRRATPPARLRPSRWAYVALVAAAAAGITLVAAWPASSPQADVTVRSYSTGTGERANLELTDGTHVTLAPRSTLSILPGFGHDQRRIRLTGQAHFDVTAARAPFSVVTGDVVTRVLGTEFDVMHYEGDRDVRVAVISGRVVSNGKKGAGVTLSAGVVGNVGDSTAVTAVITDASTYKGWTAGHPFDAMPLPEVLAMIERWYGVRFRLADTTLVHATLTGAFDYPSQSEMLSALGMLLDATLTSDSSSGQAVIIVRSRSRAGAPGVPRTNRRSTLNNSMELGR